MEEKKDQKEEIDLKDLLVVFARVWWILLLVGVVVCGGLYGVLKKTHVNKYTARATVYIIRTSGTMQAAQVSISNALVNDFMETVTMGNVLDLVRSDLGISPEALPNKEFIKTINITNKDGSRLIELSVTAKDKQDAVDLVNSLAQNSVQYFNWDLLQEEYSQYVNKVDPSQPDSYVELANPISLTKILLIALAVCLVLYLVFFFLYVLDDKINTAEDIEKYLGLNILGQIPYRHDHKGKKYITETTAAKGDR